MAAARHARDVGPELDDHVGTVHHIVGDIVASAGQWHTLLGEHPLDERVVVAERFGTRRAHVDVPAAEVLGPRRRDPRAHRVMRRDEDQVRTPKGEPPCAAT